MIYYLDTYKGKGTDLDPYHPASVDRDGIWSSIDLRPPGAEQGQCLIAVDDQIHGAISLGDDLDDLTSGCRRILSNRLSVNLHDRRLRRAMLRLLAHHGDDRSPRKWNRLRPDMDGKYRLWLGGLVDQRRFVFSDGGQIDEHLSVVSGGRLMAFDSFDRANDTNMSTGAPFPWTEVAGDMQIDTNSAKNVTASGVVTARAEFDVQTSNMYSRAPSGVATSATMIIGPCVRFQTGASTFYVAARSRDLTTPVPRISRNVAGVITNIASIAALAPTYTTIFANGSTISALMDATPLGPVTDTVIPLGRRGGMSCGQVNGLNRAIFSSFEVGDLPGPRALKINNGSAFTPVASSLR